MKARMYLLSGDEATLSRLATEPGALSALAVASEAAAAPEPPILRRAELLERQLEQTERQARGRGLISAIDTFFRRRSMRRTIDRMRSISTEIHRPVMTPATPLDLRQSWRVLHHLVTEAAGRPDGAPATLSSGGRPVGESLGHGPARLVDALATRDFARVLAPLTVEDLQSRIDIARLTRLGIDDESASAESLRKAVGHDLPRLKDYVAAAAARGECLLIWQS
jgi:hypothetical protein